MSSIPMRSHERVTMDVQAVESMLATDGIYWTDQAKDSHNQGRELGFKGYVAPQRHLTNLQGV